MTAIPRTLQRPRGAVKQLFAISFLVRCDWDACTAASIAKISSFPRAVVSHHHPSQTHTRCLVRRPFCSASRRLAIPSSVSCRTAAIPPDFARFGARTLSISSSSLSSVSSGMTARLRLVVLPGGGDGGGGDAVVCPSDKTGKSNSESRSSARGSSGSSTAHCFVSTSCDNVSDVSNERTVSLQARRVPETSPSGPRSLPSSASPGPSSPQAHRRTNGTSLASTLVRHCPGWWHRRTYRAAGRCGSSPMM